jgi:hypothetical protein
MVAQNSQVLWVITINQKNKRSTKIPIVKNIVTSQTHKHHEL